MARVPGLITKVLGTIWVIRPKALGHEMRIREKGSGVMFGTETISEFEMRRRAENYRVKIICVFYAYAMAVFLRIPSFKDESPLPA